MTTASLTIFSMVFSLFLIALFFLPGYWVVAQFKHTIRVSSFLEGFLFSSLVTIAFLALTGTIVACLPWHLKEAFSTIALITYILSGLWFFFKKKHHYLFRSIQKTELLFIVLFCFQVLINVYLANTAVTLPSPLIDGPYVNKKDHLPVRVQYISGDLPADNAIPHVVTEYILRAIPFKTERPILPGQEVSNRPILASLVITPIRAIISMPSLQIGPLARLNYVGTDWPDFTSLTADNFAYSISQTIGIFLNSLLFLIFLIYLNNFKISFFLSVSGSLLFISSPYFLIQTIYTWPKSFAAFFILASYYSYSKKNHPILPGFIMGLAYLAHPFSLVYALGGLIYLVFNCLKEDPKIKVLVIMVLPFFVTILPWLVWTKFILEIPSDLASQNILNASMKAFELLWVRIYNLFISVSPSHLSVYPFNHKSVFVSSYLNIFGAVGTIVAIPALLKLAIIIKHKDIWPLFLWLLLFPSISIIFLFSIPTVPTLHGLQTTMPMLLLIGISHLASFYGKIYKFAVVFQVIVNVLLTWHYFKHL